MKPGPNLIVKELFARIDVSAAPEPIVEIITKLSLSLGWHSGPTEAREAAEKWQSGVETLLRHEISELTRTGRFAPLAFNSSSPAHVQGSAFIEPKDPPDLKAAKTNRAAFKSYSTALKELTPRQFEALCAGILSILGVDEPVLTPSSADEGLDFYGRLHLEKHIFRDLQFRGVERQLGIWLVGQAKHYVKGDVSTPELRELVGAVQLAKGHAFGSGREKYQDLNIRVCDPVYYLFFTTGRLTTNSWTLLDRSGVIGMDGEMVAIFLADHGVGLVEGCFNDQAFKEWLTNLMSLPTVARKQ